MNLEDLRNFVTVYDLKSVSKAAVALNLTQSALSKRLQRLQNELALPLIETHNRRQLNITPAGELMYEQAQLILKQANVMNQQLDTYRRQQHQQLRIGTVPVFAQYGLTNLMNQFTQSLPNTQLQLMELQGQDLLTALKQGQVDIAIMRDMQAQQLPTSFEQQPLVSDALVAVMAKTNPLSKQATVSLADIANQSLVQLGPGSGVYELSTQLFGQANLTPNVQFMGTHIETLMGMLQEPNTISLLFNQAVQPFLTSNQVIVPLAQPVTSTLKIVRPRRNSSPVAQQFIHFLREHLK